MLKRIFMFMAMCSALASPQAKADDWGCQVLLCLSNPAGPMAVAECVPPIQRLYAAIFKWRPDPFPTCTLSNGSDSSSGGNYAYVGPASYYDGCPVGTTAASPQSSYVVAGRVATAADIASGAGSSGYVVTSGIFAGIGDGSGYQPDPDTGGGMPQKVCIGTRLGQTTATQNTSNVDDWGNTWSYAAAYPVTVYDKIAVINPSMNTFNINVIINGSLYTTVRPNSASSMTMISGN